MAEGNNGFFIFIGVLLIFLLVAAIAFWQLDRIKGIFGKEEEVPPEETFETIKLYARDKDNAILEVNYKLFDNQSVLVQEGIFSQDRIEQFEDVISNNSYHLTAWGKQYYENTQECTLNQEICNVYLERIADTYVEVVKPKKGYYVGVLVLENGTLHEPIACLSWRNMVSMTLQLKETQIPSNHYSEFDKCFTFADNSSQYKNLTEGVITFGISYNPVKERENSFSLKIIDRCNGQYEDGCAKTVGFSEIVG